MPVAGSVVPEVAGLNGSPAQYLTIDWDIRLRVSGLRTLPVLWHIVAVRAFHIHIVFIVVIVRIVFIINIVDF